jgi:hypothetical protein
VGPVLRAVVDLVEPLFQGIPLEIAVLISKELSHVALLFLLEQILSGRLWELGLRSLQ